MLVHPPEKHLFSSDQWLKECKGPVERYDEFRRPLYFQHHLRLRYAACVLHKVGGQGYNVDYVFVETYVNGAADKVDARCKLWMTDCKHVLEEVIHVDLASFNSTYSIQLGANQPITHEGSCFGRGVDMWTPEMTSMANAILMSMENEVE